LQRLKRDSESSAAIPAVVRISRRGSRIWLWAGALVTAIVALVVGAFLYTRHVHALTDKDTVVLADFTNTTGDPVFDETLKQALAVQLGESPFLNILSDARLRDTLQLMGRTPDARLDLETAREICQRTGSTAVLSGSIAPLGSQYVLGLNAVNCQTGDALVREQVQATRKEQVLVVMDDAARKMRAQLGESLGSIQKFGTPVEQATTTSFEALKALSVGLETRQNKEDEQAIPFFQRAVELDPNFAMAYGALGTSYYNMGKDDLGSQNIRRAYELRGRASERERFRISSYYFVDVTDNVEKMQELCEKWVLAYPRDWLAHGLLGNAWALLGRYENAAEQHAESLRLNSDVPIVPADLAFDYVVLGRLGDAEATLRAGEERNSSYPSFHFLRYLLAFLRNDSSGMEQEVAWGTGKPGIEEQLLNIEATSAAYHGRLSRARELSRRAIISGEQAEEPESVMGLEGDTALWEALLGYPSEVRQQAAAVLAHSQPRALQYEMALALVLAADMARAQALADDMAKRFPEGTLVQSLWVPTIRAQVALSRGDPSRAIELLQPVARYDLGGPPLELTDLSSVYVRGNAYLMAHKGTEAAAEFQKILDHRGLAKISPLGALGHLGIARAYGIEAQSEQGEAAEAVRAKARAAYQDFLTLWKDADPDIPVLKQAKAEYAKLK
jgi:eukaryotic-like serine/threonine-protein kinase